MGICGNLPRSTAFVCPFGGFDRRVYQLYDSFGPIRGSAAGIGFDHDAAADGLLLFHGWIRIRGEALTGKFVGARKPQLMQQAVKWTFVWSMGIGIFFVGIYAITGVPLLRLMTSDASVVQVSTLFLPWLIIMPLIGCPAFTWDGIIPERRQRKPSECLNGIRRSLLLVWLLGTGLLRLSGILGNRLPESLSAFTAGQPASSFRRLFRPSHLPFGLSDPSVPEGYRIPYFLRMRFTGFAMERAQTCSRSCRMDTVDLRVMVG